MSDVVSLSGGSIPVREVDEDVVNFLEDALEMARSGEIVGLAGVLSFYDFTASTALVGLHSRTSLGCLVMAQSELVDVLIDG